MRVIMTFANFSPAVASRRAKYSDDLRAPTFLGAQPLDVLVFLMAVPDSAQLLQKEGWQSRKHHQITEISIYPKSDFF
jgi:hypothetical protein